MTVLFREHLDLLEMHGRAAVHSLGQLSADDALPPRGESARSAASDHWGTLEVWAWSLENPSLHWSQGAEQESSAEYPTLVRGVAVAGFSGEALRPAVLAQSLRRDGMSASVRGRGDRQG